MEDLYNLWLVKHNILNRIEDDRKEITEIKSAKEKIKKLTTDERLTRIERLLGIE